jgi:peptidoglycan/LPS O-acetylase OafA/YrhL
VLTLAAPFVAAILSPSARWSFFATPARMGPIGAGVLVALVLSRSSVAQHARSVSPFALAGIGFACAAVFGVLTLATSWEQRWLWRGGYAVLPILYGVLVWSTAQSQVSWWGKLLSLPPVQWLGSRSYSIYLVHFPIAGLLDRTGQPAPHLERVGLMVISLLIAELSFRFVESPLRERGISRNRSVREITLRSPHNAER